MTEIEHVVKLIAAMTINDPFGGGWNCVFCGTRSTHAPDCAWVRARAFLGQPVDGILYHDWRPAGVAGREGRRCAICGAEQFEIAAGWCEIGAHAATLITDDAHLFLCYGPQKEAAK